MWQAQTSAFPAREQLAVLFYHGCSRLGQPNAGRTEAVQHAAWCVMKCTATEGCLKAGGELRAKGHVAHVHALSSIVTAPIAHLLQHPHRQPRCWPVRRSHNPTSEQTAALCPCRQPGCCLSRRCKEQAPQPPPVCLWMCAYEGEWGRVCMCLCVRVNMCVCAGVICDRG